MSAILHQISKTLQIEILSTRTFLKYIIFLKSFNSVLYVHRGTIIIGTFGIINWVNSSNTQVFLALFEDMCQHSFE